MKKILLALVSFVFLFEASSQTLPPGYSLHQSEIDNLGTYMLPQMNNQELIDMAEQRDKMGYMSMYGAIHNIDIDCATKGVWTTDVEGNMTWKLKFKSQGALAMALLFDEFYIPEGSSYYIYSSDRSWFEGPFDFTENKPSGLHRTPDVYGDEAIFEYYQPAGVIGSPSLGIFGVLHYYRFIQDPRYDQRDRGSESCQVDVNCPEGADWVDQRNSVVRLSLLGSDGAGFCTGSFVNNTSYDCKNYILTAHHCTINSTAANLELSTVRFNFQKPNCGSGNGPVTQQKVGLIRRADSNDVPGSTGSDFALLELEDSFPASWNVFYAGWDATTATPAVFNGNLRGIGIHHPAGDVKKISAAGTVANTNSIGPPNTYWRVVWTETETNWGVTEGGSSGSPLYNGSKRVIGTLFGGNSFCTPASAQSAADWYGKMERHFFGNPNPANEDLVDWLDPTATGQTVLNGAYRNASLSQPCTPQGIVAVEELNFEDVVIYPTIANDVITISGVKFDMVKEVRIFDAQGRQVNIFNVSGTQHVVPVSNLNVGVYFITFIADNGNYLTKKFTVSR